mmetsp:Transcript_65982/g.212835  ORF Transcript_65982/g.212835 Transcript_65982/m.212835 type:complete len:252 (-) Transcript_65982:559-1314(-)
MEFGMVCGAGASGDASEGSSVVMKVFFTRRLAICGRAMAAASAAMSTGWASGDSSFGEANSRAPCGVAGPSRAGLRKQAASRAPEGVMGRPRPRRKRSPFASRRAWISAGSWENLQRVSVHSAPTSSAGQTWHWAWGTVLEIGEISSSDGSSMVRKVFFTRRLPTGGAGMEMVLRMGSTGNSSSSESTCASSCRPAFAAPVSSSRSGCAACPFMVAGLPMLGGNCGLPLLSGSAQRLSGRFRCRRSSARCA